MAEPESPRLKSKKLRAEVERLRQENAPARERLAMHASGAARATAVRAGLRRTPLPGFSEIHGDRRFGDDASIVTGWPPITGSRL